MEYRDKKFKSRLQTHGSEYRKKLRVERELIKQRYKECRSTELGNYRHNNVYVTYDYIVKKIVEKWGPRDERLCLELIHTVQNKCNALILECILEADREITIEEYAKSINR